MKAIALKYDLTKDNQLVELNVSISGAEYLEIGRELDFQSEAFNTGATSIPTPANAPCKTAGLITPSMCKTVNESILNHYPYPKTPPRYPLHSHIMILKFEHSSSDIKGEGQLAFDETSALILRKCDYHYEIRDGILTVGLGEKEANRKDLRSWSFSAPILLSKV